MYYYKRLDFFFYNFSTPPPKMHFHNFFATVPTKMRYHRTWALIVFIMSKSAKMAKSHIFWWEGRFLDCDPESKSAKMKNSHIFWEGGRFLDCDSECKTGEIPKSHILKGRFLDCGAESKSAKMTINVPYFGEKVLGFLGSCKIQHYLVPSAGTSGDHNKR